MDAKRLRVVDPPPACSCGCEETALLRRAREGDEAALGEILRRYKAMARSKARAYFIAGADRDDVLQEAMIGVYKAIRDFDPDRGASFRTFAELCIGRQVLTAVKAGTRHKHGPLRQASSLDVPDEEGRPWHERLAGPRSGDPAEVAIAAEQISAIREHLDTALSELERQVLRHHVEGRSYDEIAMLMERQVKTIDNALQRIRRKLQEHLTARAG